MGSKNKVGFFLKERTCKILYKSFLDSETNTLLYEFMTRFTYSVVTMDTGLSLLQRHFSGHPFGRSRKSFNRLHRHCNIGNKVRFYCLVSADGLVCIDISNRLDNDNHPYYKSFTLVFSLLCRYEGALDPPLISMNSITIIEITQIGIVTFS